MARSKVVTGIMAFIAAPGRCLRGEFQTIVQAIHAYDGAASVYYHRVAAHYMAATNATNQAISACQSDDYFEADKHEARAAAHRQKAEAYSAVREELMEETLMSITGGRR